MQHTRAIAITILDFLTALPPSFMKKDTTMIVILDIGTRVIF
jgi:hypothetical protein